MVESLGPTEAVKKGNNDGIEAKAKEETHDSQTSKGMKMSRTRTFTANSSKQKASEETGPVPWPIPPRILSESLYREPAANCPQQEDANREFLTPQSSFAQVEAENPSFQSKEFPQIQRPDDSDSFSRENSVRRESFSSTGTGFSAVLIDSCDSESSESVVQVDTDGDEFAQFLSEKSNSSKTSVDFRGLFAEEERQKQPFKDESSPRFEKSGSSGRAEYSTTPKATRAPFRNCKGGKQEQDMVSLAEALNFSPDYKVIRTDHDPPFRENLEKSLEEERSRRNENEILLDNVEKQNKVEPGLRRPMASRQRTFVVVPQKKDKISSKIERGKKTSISGSQGSAETKVSSVGEKRHPDTVPGTPPMKGVIVRAQTHVSHVAGIRRAETGRIMSKAELRAQKSILFQESPNPKSLNPAGFPSEEDDMINTPSSTISVKLSSERSEVIDSGESPGKDPSGKKQNSLSPVPTAKVDDGSFLSPGILSRKKKFGTEEYKVDNFQFSDHEGSSGLLNRFSSGFRKMHTAVAKKSSSNENARARESAIFVTGTIDEAACKICVVCRNQLQCDVYVKDAGKKIKVESRKDGRDEHLRTTILVRQIPGETASCEVYVQQSRSSGMKTSLVALWSFYQKLEAGLKDME